MTELYKWIQQSRGDTLPLNSIYAGTTPNDGHVYVGRINNVPGKVNLHNKLIYNFWSQDFSSSYQSGEVLTTTHTYKWKRISRGELIPNNAVYSGLDTSKDKVWVGKSLNGYAGKINCHSNSSKEPKMHNLWYHNTFMGIPSRAEQKAFILVIEDNEQNDTNVDDIDEDNEQNDNKNKTSLLNYINCCDNTNKLPEWKNYDMNIITMKTKITNLNVCIGKIAEKIITVLSAVNGNIISLFNLTKDILTNDIELNLSSYSNEESNKKTKIMQSNIVNQNGFPTYILLTFSKTKIKKKFSVPGLGFGTDKLSISIFYEIYEPNNDIANTRTKDRINRTINECIESYKNTENIIKN